jgi:hypothetical protein
MSDYELDTGIILNWLITRLDGEGYTFNEIEDVVDKELTSYDVKCINGVLQEYMDCDKRLNDILEEATDYACEEYIIDRYFPTKKVV